MGIALIGLGVVFAQSLVQRRMGDEVAPSHVDLEAAATRAAEAAYVPERTNPSQAIAMTPGGAMWGPFSLPVGRRIGWIDPGDDDAMQSLKRHGSQLTDVVLDGLSLVGAEAEVQGDITLDVVAMAHERAVRVLLAVDTFGDGAATPTDVTVAAHADSHRVDLAQTLALRVEQMGADGLVLSLADDEVDDADGEVRISLLRAVRSALTPTQTLAIAVDADFDEATLRREATAVDFVLVHAHREADDHRPPGPVAPNAWLDSVLSSASAAVEPSKLVPMLAVRAGARPIGGSDAHPMGEPQMTTWAQAMTKSAMAGVVPRWVESLASAMIVLPGPEGVASKSGLVLTHHQPAEASGWLVWLTDGASVANSIAISREHGISHVGLDELGGEDPRIWQVLAAESTGPKAIQSALSEVPPPDSWQIIGDGVEMRVRTESKPGHCAITLNADGFVASERFETLPLQVTVERRAPVGIGHVALTFDDGPDPVYTPAIADLLAEHGVKATFFLVGTRVERDPEVVQRLVAAGHEIGNHSFSHPDFGVIAQRNADLEIRATNLLISSVTGRTTLLFRPPFRADDTPQSAEDLAGLVAAMRNGMTVVASTIDPRDWERPGADAIVERVLKQAAQDGSGVVLLHDGGGDRAQTVEALRVLLPSLRARGFDFVQVHDLFGTREIDHTNPPVPTLMQVRANQAIWWGGTWLLRTLRLIALGSLLLVGVRFGSMTILAVAYAIRHRRQRDGSPPSETANVRRAVSVVIPAYNEERVIVRTIQSILASRDVDLEVIVVDDGSSDNTEEVVHSAYGSDPRVHCARLANGGKARALNYGFRRAAREIVVALDADTLFRPDTIAHLVDAMNNPRIAAVAGRAVVGNVRGFIGRCQALEYVCGQAIERRAWAALGVVSVVPGAVGAWRRDAVLMIGGFARDTLAEDSDLTLGLQVVGWRVQYAPDAVALTEAPESVRALLKQRFRWTFGVLQTLWKHRRALLNPVAGRPVVGWVLLPTIVTCHLGVPLLAPLVDLAGLAAVYLGYGRELIPYAIVMFASELLLAATAMILDRAPIRIAWDWLLQRVVYRWLLFFALARAGLVALQGGAVGWNKLARTGTVQVAKGLA
jgi:peptidoglycan/xylan/chitin deacetylase (PgdA/CDA1 family)/GT2 family glycosyltransferase